MPESSSASVAKINLPGARIGDHLRARTLDDDFAVVQYRDALGKCQRSIHVVLDHHDGHIALAGVEPRANPMPLGLGKSGARGRWTRREAAISCRSRPNINTDPAPAVRSPVMRLNSVVLPVPFGPMISRRSPRMTESDTFFVAGKPPNRLLKCASSSAGAI